MTRKDIPNLITLFRFVLVVPIVCAMLQDAFWLALVLFAVAGVSDGIDGFLAKRFAWQSRLGSILDPLADKLLLVASFAALSYLHIVPWWFFWLVVARDLIIVAGALAYHRWVGRYELTPFWSSKLNTALQILLVLWVMVQQHWLPAWTVVTDWFTCLVIISIVYSGLEYILVWGNRAWRHMSTKA